jgi:hypothetical protein
MMGAEYTNEEVMSGAVEAQFAQGLRGASL